MAKRVPPVPAQPLHAPLALKRSASDCFGLPFRPEVGEAPTRHESASAGAGASAGADSLFVADTVIENRILNLEAGQRELIEQLGELTASVTKLRHALTKNEQTGDEQKHQIDRLQSTLTDACEHLGGSVVSMHRDFGVLVRKVGATIETAGAMLETDKKI